jgi:hypothetical protein
MQRYGTAPGLGWLPAVLPFAFAASAAWFVAAVFLTAELKPLLVDTLAWARALEARHAGLFTLAFAAFGALFACVGFARTAWTISEALCEPPENAHQFSSVGPAALGLLGAVLLALTYTRL